MTADIKTRVVVHHNFWKRWESDAKLVVAAQDDGQEMPGSLPDGTPLLTKKEKMEQDFERAGEPKKGAKDD